MAQSAGPPLQNPFSRGAQGAASGPQPPLHFRRHGSAEHGYGGGFPAGMGLTPPHSPSRSRPGSPRSPRSNRRNREDAEDAEDPPARRDRSRDRMEREAAAAAAEPSTSMPAEWGGRTLRLEKMVQECTTEILKLNGLVLELQNKVTGDHNRLNALEMALPDRVHRCEERQANHIEILNQLGRTAHEQISTLQHRMNTVEQLQSQAPNFGGGAGSNGNNGNVPTPQNFDIGSPLSGPPPARETPSTHDGAQDRPNVSSFDSAGPPLQHQTRPNIPYFDP